MTTDIDLERALAKLGNTRDEIAASLQVKGITGQIEENARCPIANYLNQEFPNYKSSVLLTYIILSDPHCKDIIIGLENSPITKFVEAFDERLYPELISKDESA